MNPYRQNEIEINPPQKKRSRLKTFAWKLALKNKGKWKERFQRGCRYPGCKRIIKKYDNPFVEDGIFCYIRHCKEARSK